MASLFTTPLQAILGSSPDASTGPLAAAEAARGNHNFLEHYTPDFLKDWKFTGQGIEGWRWNKSFPYQLLILKEHYNGQRNFAESINTAFGQPSYRVEAEFTLPIPPQEMSIQMPFAINTSLTLGGVVEEHNGAPLRMISFGGTTGVTPLRSQSTVLKQSNLATGIFLGTVTAARSVVQAAFALAGAQEPDLLPDDDSTWTGTGYYQFRLLQTFLEAYANMKKMEQYRSLRLAFAVWKDQAVYLVTPQQFTLQRSASSPMEYTYQVSLKAWKRVALDAAPPAQGPFRAVTRDANAFAQLLNKIDQARTLLNASADTLRAVSADVDRLLLEPLREVNLFCKDAAGLANLLASDLPASLAASLLSASVAYSERLGLPANNIKTQGLKKLGVRSGKSQTRGGNLGGAEQALRGADPIVGAFLKADYEVMSKLRLSELPLPPATQKSIAEERRRVSRLTRLDFETYRNNFVEFAARYADSIGAGAATYNLTYGRPTVTPNREATDSDFELLYSLNQVILEMNRLAASTDTNSSRLTTVDAVAGMASASGIAFRIPVSKYTVPFPYGSTLEQLAAQYLGDANRWHEIATLNGLRQPYVDEEGFVLPLLVNGSGNTVEVTDNGNLYRGQLVWVGSNAKARARRHILSIKKVGTTAVLTLDGDPDLDQYDVLAAANLQAFLPDTVNSQMMIYIPSSEDADAEDYRTKAIPGVSEFDQVINSGGIDLLLTQSGDLAVTQNGDCRLAIGLTNSLQRLRVALATPRGSMLQHPDFGAGFQVGASSADISPRQAASMLQDLVRSDPAFTGISSLSIVERGPLLQVNLSVGARGANRNIPLTLNLTR